MLNGHIVDGTFDMMKPHIGIVALDKANELRRVNARWREVRLKLHSRKLRDVVKTL